MITVVWQKDGKITYKWFSILLTYEETDNIGKQKGYGRTLVIGFPYPFIKRIQRVITDFKAGIDSKYPICCVLNYCIDTLLNRPSAQLRWSNRTEYVECELHVRLNGGRQVIPSDLW